MAPAGDAGAPFRLVARADLDTLVGGFQPRGERAAGRAPRHPVTATALLFDPGGETLHVACAGAEVCVAHCRVAQGTTPSGDVRARFVVDDVTPSPRPAPPPEAAPFRPEPSPRVPVVDRTIRELCAISGNRRCVAARADSGVEVHYYDARCSSDAKGTPSSAEEETNKPAFSETRVFVIPDTAGASAVASDASASASAKAHVAVASPGGRKRVVVYAVPPFASRQNVKQKATVVFDIAADIILGLAHPVRAMTWLGATLVIGAPRGAVAVRVADGYATPLAGAVNPDAVSPKREARRRARARAAALAALAPRRPTPGGASYETMFGSDPMDPIGSRAAEAEDDGGEATEAPAAPALAVASGGAVANDAAVAAPTPADVSIVARAPDGTLMRVWLHGEAEDEDVDEADADRGTASASANAPAVFVLDDASKNGAKTFFARSEPVDLTCAFPFAVAAPRGGTREKLARAVDLTGLAPGDSHALALGMSGDGARENLRSARETRLLIAGAPRGAALGRGDDRNDAVENRDPASFSCPASASALLAARGGTLELHRARSTRERVVALAVAGRLEEAVALADARGGTAPAPFHEPSSPSLAVLTRAECGFLAVARLDFELAASLWRSVGDALSLSELLPYFPRQGGSRTAFRGRVEASAVGAGAETDERRFVKRLGARETVSAFSQTKYPGAPCLADLETVVAAHASRPDPREVGRLCRAAKRALVPLFAARPARDGDPRKRRLDTLTLRLWAETGDAARLERALLGEETTDTFSETKEEQSFARNSRNSRDVDVSVLGPACTSSGRHFARAIVHWRLERNDDAAFETYAALSSGALVEAPAEPPSNERAAESSPRVAAAVLAARLLRERCREDLRGDARPGDEDVRRWTRRHVAWILREAPEEGVAALASPRVARAADLQFVTEACVAANATRATRARVLRDRVRPFAPDRANADAHTALAVALWEAAEEALAEADGLTRSPPAEDVGKKTSPESDRKSVV